MKRLPLLALWALGAFAQTPAVHNVYILPMAGGLDQYLAGQLTREHVMNVVADPKAADAVLTDRLGEAFEQKLAKILPRDNEDDDTDAIRPGFRSGGTTGTFFLVDAKSRHVLWSAYEKRPRSITADSLNREAGSLAKKLKETFGK